ncbi:hypothetical protein NFI95_04955 [Acetobacteraceae bacterium KSS8]|uniref:Phage late control D family protein n=1 Tax=Endosaccharibacter trunci TaxID=2812733 RepID=A0ABT1W4J8_9PROT|nr:hypothetical protein [Acetobacteraceae bacterium KSS8]
MTDDGIVRRPRLRLTIAGTVVPGCVSAEIRCGRGSSAATYRVEVSSDAVSAVLQSAWLDAASLDVKIEMAFAEAGYAQPGSWLAMIQGPVDRITAEPLFGLVVLDGRDNAAKLIDMPLQDGYLNKTASEVAADLAAQCGLQSDVDETTGLIGQYYQIQHSKTVFGAYSRHANGWDLLSELAQIQNYELWVDGTTLHFKQAVPDASPFDVSLQQEKPGEAVSCGSLSALSLDRTLGVSGAIQVRVASWNSRQKQTITQSYPAEVADGARLYTVLKPNLLPDEAQAIARSTYLQLRARQRILSATMPGELSLAPRRSISLSGTGTGWDTTYVVDHIVRHISAERGFTQTLTAITLQDGT